MDVSYRMSTRLTELLYLVWFLGGLSGACQVDGGEFFQIIQVKEELEVGTVVGLLDLDNPSAPVTIMELETNRYYRLIHTDVGYGFEVKKKIDVDTGVNRLQTLLLSCKATSGPTLEIEVEFEVKDINDHTPVFVPSSHYQFHVPESVAPGTQVGIVRAEDDDIKNAYITYELLEKDGSVAETPVFYVGDVSGGSATIMLSSELRLDYESRKTFEFKVVAKDCQNRMKCIDSQRSGEATVIVLVEDTDDLNPQFSQPSYQALLKEDVAVGEMVVEVHAEDRDELNHAVLYSLTGDGSEHFHIHRATGEITVRDRIGLSAGQNFLLQATAYQVTDNSKKDTATLFISVVASDSHIPKFMEREYSLSVSEYTIINKTLLQIPLLYENNDQTLPLELSLTDNTDQTFRVVYSGKYINLILDKPLDYETISQYYMILTVSNGKYEAKTRVTVNIINENDNNPEFSQSSYVFSTTGDNKLVGRIRAMDADQSDEEISYRIVSSENSNMFELTAVGELYMTSPLSTYTEDEYTLLVEAEDSQRPPRKSNAVVTVHVYRSGGSGSSQSSATIGRDGVSKENILIFMVAGISGLVGIIGTIVIVFLCKRQWFRSSKSPTDANTTGRELSTPDQTVLPLFTNDRRQLASFSTLERECTYRDMCELNQDESYQSVWRDGRTSIEPGERSSLLRHHLPDTSGSDSGRSSGTVSRNSPFHVVSIDMEKTTPTRGMLNTILQEKRLKRDQIDAVSDKGPQGGALYEAPEEFRSADMGSRAISPAISVGSRSNTSDYGSNAADDSNSTRNPASTLIVINSKHHNPVPVDSLDEAANRRAFTTFHSDQV